MKRNDGAVLIGFYHKGKEDAEEVISLLEKYGLKNGDEIVVELSSASVEGDIKNVQSGYYSRAIKELAEKINAMREEGIEAGTSGNFEKLVGLATESKS